MKEVYGDIWEYPADVICITTNGVLTKAGNGVMGRGVALQAKERFPGIEKQLGRSLKEYGNQCVVWTGPYQPICFFPVKHHWREQADVALIIRSAVQLEAIVKRWPGAVFVLPRPGCGNGGLAWADVKPLIEFLPDQVHVIEKESNL
jgi:hypothetical protein